MAFACHFQKAHERDAFVLVPILASERGFPLGVSCPPFTGNSLIKPESPTIERRGIRSAVAQTRSVGGYFGGGRWQINKTQLRLWGLFFKDLLKIPVCLLHKSRL